MSLGKSFIKWTNNGIDEGYPKCCIEYFVFRLVLYDTLGILIPPIQKEYGRGPCLCPKCAGKEEIACVEIK